MNSRERFLNSLLGRPVDRFFRYEHGMWPSTRERWLQEGYAPEAGCYDDDPGFRQFFGMDPLHRVAINSGYTDSPYYPPFDIQILSESPSHRIYVDNDGITKRTLVHHADTSMPQFIRYPVVARRDWERVLARLDPADALQRIGDPASLLRQHADPDVANLLSI